MKTRKVRAEYSDGNYWLVDWPNKIEAMAPIEISEGEWQAYQAYTTMAQRWHERLRDLSNDQYYLDHPEDRTEDVLGPAPDEDNLDREPKTLLDAVSEPVKNLTAAQITALEKRGWTFMMTGPSEWDWIKFSPPGPLQSEIARGGDETWARDIAAICGEEDAGC